AHAGYSLVGVVSTMGSESAVASVLFYMLAYTVSVAGAFGALILCGRRGAEAVSYEDLAGIGRRHPAAALAFTFFLLSLAGVPPTAGFFGKLYVFGAAIDAELYALAVIGLLNSVVGAYYYLRVIVYMYMREPAPGAPIATPMRSGYVAAALVVAALFVLGIGLLPGSSLEAAALAGLRAGGGCAREARPRRCSVPWGSSASRSWERPASARSRKAPARRRRRRPGSRRRSRRAFPSRSSRSRAP